MNDGALDDDDNRRASVYTSYFGHWTRFSAFFCPVLIVQYHITCCSCLVSENPHCNAFLGFMSIVMNEIKTAGSKCVEVKCLSANGGGYQRRFNTPSSKRLGHGPTLTDCRSRGRSGGDHYRSVLMFRRPSETSEHVFCVSEMGISRESMDGMPLGNFQCYCFLVHCIVPIASRHLTALWLPSILSFSCLPLTPCALCVSCTVLSMK